jgi:allantoicase
VTDFELLPDLAARSLGGGVIHANDELFAAADHLVHDAAPVFNPATFGPKGQIYDGWESRRRRSPGHDHAIVRLGAPGVVRGVVVDTAFFTGNYPPEVSVEACGIAGHPAPDEVAAADWVTLVPRSPVAGDSRNRFAVEVPVRFTHVRLTIYPDGGVARLRVHGEPVPDPRLLPGGLIDLAALENGARVTGCSNMFYGSPGNLLRPGLARVMGEGWETARRRDDGNDWVEVALAAPGRVLLAELDTTHFKGNAPGAARVRAIAIGAGGANHEGSGAGRGGSGKAGSGISGEVGSGRSGNAGNGEAGSGGTGEAGNGKSGEAGSSGSGKAASGGTGEADSDAGTETTADLLPRTPLQPDTRHRFPVDGPDGVEAVRLDIFPDGGMARFRLWGRLGPVAADRLTRRWLEALPPAEAAQVLKGRSVDALIADVAGAWSR